MSLVFHHWKGGEGGGPPIPTGDTDPIADIPCPGTGPKPATYTFTVTHRTENAQWYQESFDGGNTWSASIAISGAPVVGPYVWTTTYVRNTSYLANQAYLFRFRYRSVGDVASTQAVSTSRTASILRCARPVTGTLSGDSVYSCGNIKNSGTVSWTSSPTANIASASLTGTGFSSTNQNGTQSVTSANAGNVLFAVTSISGFAADNYVAGATVSNLGPGYNNPCNGFTATCGPVYETCDCPSYGLCVNVGSCNEVRDAVGTCCNSGSISPCDGRCFGVGTDCCGNCPPYQCQDCSSGCPDACIPISSSCGPDPGCGTCAAPAPTCWDGSCSNPCPPIPSMLVAASGSCSLGCFCPTCTSDPCDGVLVGWVWTAGPPSGVTCSGTFTCNGAQTSGCGAHSGAEYTDCAFSGNFSSCAGCLFGGQDQSGSFSVSCSDGSSAGGGW